MVAVKRCNCLCFWFYASLVLFVIFLILAIVFPIVIEKVMNDQAKETIVMSADKRKLWGEIPGDTQTIIMRNFYFYDFNNTLDVIFKNATPVLVESPPYQYQEFENFTDLEYKNLNDTNTQTVQFKFREWFVKTKDGMNDSDVVHFGNVGPLGVWYQMKHAEDFQIALQSLSSLILGMENSLITTAVAQGISPLFINQKTVYDQYFTMANIDPNNFDKLWYDRNYGWSNWTTLQSWVNASQNGVFSGASYLLREYFHLSFENMYILLNKLSSGVNSIIAILKKHYCHGQDCTSRYLAVKQWVNQGVTLNPPPGGNVPPSDSIVQQNFTASGYPELSYYYQKVFLKNISNATEYQNLVFSEDWAATLWNHVDDPVNNATWLKDSNILLHRGNLIELFQVGKKYEASNDTADLQPMMTKFNLSSMPHTVVFWKYMKYMVDDFSLNKKMNGTTGHAAMGGIISQAMYQTTIMLQDFLNLDLISRVVQANVTKNNISCVSLFNESLKLSGANESQLNGICALPNIQAFNLDSFKYLIKLCSDKEDVIYDEFKRNANMTTSQIYEFCPDTQKVEEGNPKTFSNMVIFTQKYLRDYYNCYPNAWRCSDQELMWKQWGSSNITRNVPELLKDQLNRTNTVSDWYPDMFPYPLEYLYFTREYMGYDVQDINETLASTLLSFDKLYSLSLVPKVFLYPKNNMTKEFEETFLVDNPLALSNYLRYIMIQYGMGTLNNNKTVNEAVFGYTDPLIKTLKTMNPTLGGDPSIDSTVALNGPNNTVQDQTTQTGASDCKWTRSYTAVDNISYTTVKAGYFNGNETSTVYNNPWRSTNNISGTDSFQNPPGVEPGGNNLLYITDLYRGGPGVCSSQIITYNGVDCYRYQLEESFLKKGSDNPVNEPFYMDRWNGIMNLTSVKQAPLFASKFYYMDADESLFKNINIYKSTDPHNLVKFDRSKDIYIDVEPYSGAGIAAALRLQTSFYLSEDELFPTSFDSLIPIFSLNREGRWGDGALDDQLGALKLGLKLKIVIRIAGFCLAGVFLLLGVILGYCHCKKRKTTSESEALLQSKI